MESESNSGTERHALSTHILSASVVMIGVSTTLIGLVKVAKTHAGSSHVDRYTALTALLFLLSALASYLSIRWASSPGVRQIFDRMADYIFICGLICISAISFFFAYEFI